MTGVNGFAEDGPTRKTLNHDEATEFICNACSKGGSCMGCGEVAVEVDTFHKHDNIIVAITTGRDGTTAEPALTQVHTEDQAATFVDPTTAVVGGDLSVTASEKANELSFRCFTCKRLSHYGCLRLEDEDLSTVEIATFYQKDNSWQCGDCSSYIFQLDKILAWRHYTPPNVDGEPPKAMLYNVDYKQPQPFEYLVKWVGRSYRRLEWVPHMWLLTTNAGKLRQFTLFGTKVQILDNPVTNGSVQLDSNGTKAQLEELLLFAEAEDEKKARRAEYNAGGPPVSLPDAELRIPPLWKTADRVLDVLLMRPKVILKSKNQIKRKNKRTLVDSDDEIIEESSDQLDSDAQSQIDAVFNDGEQPSDDLVESVDDWERTMGRKVAYTDIDKVLWAFIKWDDLPYDEGLFFIRICVVGGLMESCRSNVGFAAAARLA